MSVLPLLHPALRYAAGMAILSLAVAGCATWQAPASADDAPLRERAVSETKQGVRVSAAVLGTEDSKRMFGADINKSNVQPVWFEVHNGTSHPLWLLRSGTDPDYFSPLEVAWSLHGTFSGATNARIDDYFNKLGFKNPILPGTTHEGILFTNPDRITKLVNVDLFGTRTLIPFSLFVRVPDDISDAGFARYIFQYPDSAVTDYKDLASLRAALERLPCCATDAGGAAQGDPLNVLIVGELGDIGAAGVRRNYRRDLREGDTEQRVFGRAPDAVLRKQAQGGAPATWIRVWLAPVRFQGQPVYLAQAGRPVGGRFAPAKTAKIVLHGDVDEARNLLIQDMMYSGGLDKLGFVNGVGPAPQAQPRATLDGARYFTDGLRAVLFFAPRPLSLSDVEILDWVPYLEGRGAASREESGNARK
ncbi:LssY C-terminal domain-containing protein [Cupriavidus sp. 2MCAB6]|uniref:LssY C-terminal domain-containing protein n=1 Tax=Cupriavidus sp. 2MCAB6 TaxID=3232981 RepID=UPI003F902B87